MGFGLRSRGIEERSQTETASSVIEAVLNANAAPYAGGSGAVEYAAGLLSRPLSVSSVEGTDLLTHPVLAEIGRGCLVRGESLHALTINDGYFGYRQRVPGRSKRETILPAHGVIACTWQARPNSGL